MVSQTDSKTFCHVLLLKCFSHLFHKCFTSETNKYLFCQNYSRSSINKLGTQPTFESVVAVLVDYHALYTVRNQKLYPKFNSNEVHSTIKYLTHSYKNVAIVYYLYYLYCRYVHLRWVRVNGTNRTYSGLLYTFQNQSILRHQSICRCHNHDDDNCYLRTDYLLVEFIS